MPREALEFRVVVASPSDVFELRKIIFEVIRELDRIFEVQNITIRGLGWEENASPGIDSEPQRVISTQILRDYDILIAVFGAKLGSATSTDRSGTVEEIENAISKENSEMGMHRVQVYFRDKIDSISSISLDELQRLADYRNSLSERGILYREFKSNDELQREVRVNLQRPISDYLQRRDRHPVSAPHKPPDTQSEASAQADDSRKIDSANDLGFLDYQEKAEAAVNAANASMSAMSGLLEEITAGTNQNVEELETISSPLVPATEKKKVVNSFADFLKSRAARLKHEALSAKEYFANFFDALSFLIDMDHDFSDAQKHATNMTELLTQADILMQILSKVRESVTSFKKTIGGIPRVTIQFNQAKKLCWMHWMTARRYLTRQKRRC
jgi:hypothetical protein